MLRFRPLQGWALPALVCSLLAPVTLAAQTSVDTTILTAPGGAPGDAFGRSVAISGDTLVVGAPGDDERGENAGAAYVFVRQPSGEWRLQQKVMSWSQRRDDWFGWSVDVDGNTLVVGAPGTQEWRGGAYVFRRQDGRWTEQVHLLPDEVVAGDRFGWRVAVDDDTLVASAPWRAFTGGDTTTHPGGLWFFRRSGGGWAVDEAVLGGVGEMLGFSLDIEGGTVVAGYLARWGGSDDVLRATRTVDGWSLEHHSTSNAVPRDGRAEAARFAFPVHLDTSPDGNVVVADGDTLRRVTADGVVTTLGPWIPVSGWDPIPMLAVGEDGTLWFVSHTSPTPFGPYSWQLGRYTIGEPPVVLAAGEGRVDACEPEPGGSVLLGGFQGLMRVSSSGLVTRISDLGIHAIARLSDSEAYVADGRVVYRMSLDTGQAVVVAGQPPVTLPLSQDGTGLAASFDSITDIALDDAGNLWVADGHLLRQVSPSFEVRTVAGQPNDWVWRRRMDGTGSGAVLYATELTVAFGGLAVFAEVGTGPTGTVRTGSPDGTVRTIAGVSGVGVDDGPAYDVAVRGGRLLAGAPRAHQYLGAAPRTGQAWIFEAGPLTPGHSAPSTPIFRVSPIPYGRVGAAVAFTSAGDVVLGPANGCVWVRHDACGDDTYATSWFSTVFPIRLLREDADGLWWERSVLPTTGITARSGYGSALASEDRWLVAGAPEWDYRPQDPPPHGDITGPGRVFVYDLSTLDSDGDGMPDDWEDRFGLNATDPDDASSDADGDGVSNRDEFVRYSHPRNDPAFTRFFAEGATSDFFETRISIANPSDAPAAIALRFLCAGGTAAGTTLTVPALASRTVVVNDVAQMARAECSTTLESDRLVVADRLMTWSRTERYGSHGERAIAEPSPIWYLAEGATHSGFDLFYLLQNPGASPTDVRVTYLRPSGPPLEKTYSVAAHSRHTIWVNVELFPGDEVTRPGLANAEVSAVVEAVDGTPIVVERAMYRTRGDAAADARGTSFEAGHAGAGIRQPSTSWFFAEGATGTFFDLFLLLANPSSTSATVQATYLLAGGGTLTKTYLVAPQRRFNIWVDEEEVPEGSGLRPLANLEAVSVTLESDVPIVAERAMWWPGPTPATWTEAHASAGATTTALEWIAAAGEVGDTPRTDTYYLIANPKATNASVYLSLLFDDGSPSVGRGFNVPAFTRLNVDVRSTFPEAIGKRFGALVTSLGYHAIPGLSPPWGYVPIVVEWAVYSDALGQCWAAGANALATPLK